MGRKPELEACDFWKRLEEAWAAEGLPTSQNAVAKEFGWTGNGTTGRWYRGDTLPQANELMTIARRGAVTVDWLLTGREPRSPVEPDSDLGKLLRIWNKLNHKNQEHLLGDAEGQLARQQQPPSVDAPAQKPERWQRAKTR